MHSGKLVFAQLMDHVPLHVFRKCVARYDKTKGRLKFSHYDQFLCMAFAQLTFRESLRDIESCLRAHKKKLYHLGIRGGIARSTLADANESRDYRIYEDFALYLMQYTRQLYAGEKLAIELEATTYALDSTTIDLCLSLFPWAKFCADRAAVKLHTLLDLHGNIPSFIHITNGTVQDIKILDILPIEAGSFYIMDRGFGSFLHLYSIHQSQAFFVVRTKKDILLRRTVSRPVDKTTGLRSDQTVLPAGTATSKKYLESLRRVVFYDEINNKRLILLTNNFELSAIKIAQLYKSRWQIELFFKWIKQHLKIKSFFGTSDNAVKTQIWIAIAVYLLVAILKKQHQTPASLHTILQILSLTLFEKIPINQLLENIDHKNDICTEANQLNFIDILTGQ